jgi:DNA repair protein RecN (Recombination protein N)
VALRQVEAKLELDPRLAHAAESLRELVAIAEDANRWVRDYGESLEHDPSLLAEIDERLNLLRDLKKKYGGSLDAVLATADASARELSTLENLSREIAEAEAARERVRDDLLTAAKKLTAARKKAAAKMEKEVERELADLDMAGTRFVTPVEPLEEGGVLFDAVRLDAAGADRVEFLLSPNVGEHPRPLVRIASGGELSRVMLAIKRVLSRHFPVPTLVFDEVDAGVGGAQAERLGRKLQEVAAEHQVLCITHLPQIAALADRHYVVRKGVSEGRTHTTIDLLDEPGRIEELARMLGGEQITDAARAAARALRTGGRRPSRQPRQ